MAYLPKLNPSVGGGLGGLPERKVSVKDSTIDNNHTAYPSYGILGFSAAPNNIYKYENGNWTILFKLYAAQGATLVNCTRNKEVIVACAYYNEYVLNTFIWDGNRYIEIADKMNYSSTLHAPAISGDGKVLFASTGSLVKVYDWSDESFKWIFRKTFSIDTAPGSATSISTNEDGTMFFSSKENYPYFNVYFVNGTLCTPMPRSGGLSYWAYYGKFSKDGKRLVVGSNTFKVFNLINGTWTVDSSLPSSTTTDVAISEDGNTIAFSDSGANVSKVYDYVGGSWVVRPPIDTSAGQYDSCALSNDGKTVVFTGRNSPRVIVEDFNGTSWTRRALPPSIPGGTVFSSAFIKN